MKALKELVLASHNKGKIEEITKLLEPLGTQVFSASDFKIKEPEETGSTFEENAILKARYVAKTTGKPALADDSGLVIPALNGFPGLITGRYSKSFSSLQDCFSDLEGKLEGRSNEAQFVCVLCLYFPDGHHQEYTGLLNGQVVFPARGEDGFCFDFVFQPEGEHKTLAELGRSVKNNISHRAIALRKFIDQWK